MTRLLSLLLLIILTSACGGGKYADRQVIAMPEQSSQPPVLSMDQHIRFQTRPAETYSFPIPIGDIGPSESLYSGANQYPFYCMSVDSDLGQPVVDNLSSWGVTVYATDTDIGNKDKIIGYSKDCGLTTQVNYYALLDNDEFILVKNDIVPPTAQQLFRVETGTINRFIYLMAMPVAEQDMESRDSSQIWNNKLIYQFAGGTGIGFRQGRLRVTNLLNRRIDQLKLGYAVISSSGNRTSHTYNMLLAEDTARRVKHNFVGVYGEPEYTVGIGGSGGGLAQYLIGQNSQGIIDAAIPLYSYADMVTQTLYALDCDLLNSYYLYHAEDTEFWQHWPNRRFLEGLSANNGEAHKTGLMIPINRILAGKWPIYPKGNSQCIEGFFGLSTFLHNPAQGHIDDFFSDALMQQNQWSYWHDLAQIYGQDEQGFTRSAWGNEGVQYGLSALRDGDLSVEQFIHVNWHIGSWKTAHQMQAERFIGNSKGQAFWISMWSNHNITRAQQGLPAPRISGDAQAIAAAYTSGQVFIGDIDLPIIDLRHYLEDEFDMHHMSASFEARARMQEAMGHHKHQVIWVAHKDFTPIDQAFAAMDNWMQNIQKSPDTPVWQVKPEQIQDQCFAADGQIIAAGKQVWDGEWNAKKDGLCSQEFTQYSNSRIEAGGPWSGSIFQCHLITIEEAIEQGQYGDINVRPEMPRLNKIFPNGVCDFSQGDAARPF